jgi:hypothetical protein
MTEPLVVLLLIELVAAIVLGQVATVHRSPLDRAFMEWHQHPTAESEQAFVRPKRIPEIQRWAFSGVVFAVLADLTALVYRITRSEPAASEWRPSGGVGEFESQWRAGIGELIVRR